jgi:hypothetical protein
MTMIKSIGILLAATAATWAGEWQPLFTGKNLDGWKASEREGVFSVIDDGVLKVEGGRSHLFWMGTNSTPVTFTDFELSAQVKTTPGSNSGLFFHTKYQQVGWPAQGYEAQVNSTHKDKRKTGSIYAVKDVMNDSPSTDGQWFDYLIQVKGKSITVRVDGKVVNEYTEPDDLKPEERYKSRRLGSGTFAIQGHDPKSVTFYRDIKVRIPGN